MNLRYSLSAIIILILISVSLTAQNNETDSLLSLIKTAPNDSLKAEYYYRLGNSYSLENSFESRVNAFLIAYKLFENQPISENKINNMTQLGHSYIHKGDYKSAEKIFNKAIHESKKAKDLELEFSATIDYLEAFLNLKSPVKGLETVLELKNKAIAANNKELLFKSYQLKNKHYLVSGIKLEERKALADTMLILAQELQDSFLIQRAYFELAGTTFDEKSIDYYLKSRAYTNSNDRLTLSSLYNNLSGRYSFLRNYDLALVYADSAYNVSVEVNRKVGVAASLYRKGEAYFFKNDFKKSLDYGLKALNAFKEANVLRRQDICAEMISEAYKNLGQFEKSLFYKELQFQLSDSLKKMNELEDLQFVEQRFAYELNQKRDSTNIAMKTLKLESTQADLEKQKMKQYLLYGGIGMFLILIVILTIGFQRKKRDNLLIQEQKMIVEDKNKEILDSINYAKRIQSAILPPSKIVKEYLKDSFIIYLPKDIVAGDFYWMEHKDNKVLFAAADCTGHGVPGAMVSVVCNNGLNRSVKEHNLIEPGKILDKTREIVVQEFEKSEEEVKDGMDIALCSVEGNILKYAGAHIPLWLLRDGDIIETKANKQPIGKYDTPEPYLTHEFELKKGDTIYIFSDGYVDQFGGEKGKKFKSRAFKDLILANHHLSMDEQRKVILDSFDKWKGKNEQVDDVCVIGVRIN